MVPVPNSDGLAAVFVAVAVPNKPPVVPAWVAAVPVVAAGVLPKRPPVAGAVAVAVPPPKREGVAVAWVDAGFAPNKPPVAGAVAVVLAVGVPNSEVPVVVPVVVPAVPPNRVLVAGALVVAPPKLPKRDMMPDSVDLDQRNPTACVEDAGRRVRSTRVCCAGLAKRCRLESCFLVICCLASPCRFVFLELAPRRRQPQSFNVGRQVAGIATSCFLILAGQRRYWIPAWPAHLLPALTASREQCPWSQALSFQVPTHTHSDHHFRTQRGHCHQYYQHTR